MIRLTRSILLFLAISSFTGFLSSGMLYDDPDELFLCEEYVQTQDIEKKGIKWKCQCNRFHDWTENYCNRCETDSGWSIPYDMYGNPFDPSCLR